MTHGKNICKQLKEVRKRIAEENDIPLEIEECSYKGECRGTCPRCEAEVRYLENALADRLRLGKVATVAGIALALAGSASAQDTTGVRISCPDIQQKVMPSIDTVGRKMATLHGTVIDSKTKEPIPFCNVVVKQDGKTVGGANTNFDGIFSMRLPVGVYDISTSFMGYTTHLRMGVQLNEDKDETILLESSAISLGLMMVVGMPESKYPIIEIDPYGPTQQMERDGVKVIVR